MNNETKQTLLIDDLRVIFEDQQPPTNPSHKPEFVKDMLDMRWSWFTGGAQAMLEAMGLNDNLYIIKAPARYEPKIAETLPVRPQPKTGKPYVSNGLCPACNSNVWTQRHRDRTAAICGHEWHDSPAVERWEMGTKGVYDK